jgi:2-aminobenzoate-CoA ligase
MAFVVLRQGHEASEALAAELSQHVADTTEPYKAPRFVEFVPSLPRGDRDKLDRKRLAESARAAADARGLEARA